MPNLSDKSIAFLNTCDERLRRVVYEAIKLMNFAVIEGHRNQEEQHADFLKGASKLDWPDSPHNDTPSRAVHLVPYPLDWDDWKKFYYLGGLIVAVGDRLGIKVRWGGDWKGDQSMNETFDHPLNDLCHFEVEKETPAGA